MANSGIVQDPVNIARPLNGTTGPSVGTLTADWTRVAEAEAAPSWLKRLNELVREAVAAEALNLLASSGEHPK